MTKREPACLHAILPRGSRAAFAALPMFASFASFAGSLRLLRVTWTIWIASFLWYFSFPLLILIMLTSSPTDAGYLVECGDPVRVLPDDLWSVLPSWDDRVWLWVVLTVLVPPALHWLLVRRVGSPFVVRRADGSAARDYRSPPAWVVETSPRVVRRLVALYAGRMGLTLGLSFFTLLHTALYPVISFCCLCSRCDRRMPFEQMVPECLFFAALLFAVALYHVPLTARILGRPPRVGDDGKQQAFKAP